MKFIHAADLHIDSPLKGLESYEGAPLARLQGATRVGFQHLVCLALEQAVDFVIIAGDLFDGKWQDMHTGLWTAGQFRELERAGIRVFLLQGNHDAASRVPHALTWPSNVHVFSVERPETVILDELRVAVHGQGFAREKITTDLASGYPDAVPHHFNIGVLHTSLTGNPEHDTYAATNLTVLLNRGYDYWALGHIHARSVPPLHESPYIAYSGNLQGRHIRETGAKGCLVATVDEGDLTAVEFVATDTVRWQTLEVSLEPHAGRSELLDAVRQQLALCRESAEGRLVATRVIVRGVCEVHRQLARAADHAEITAEIRNLAGEVSDDVWVEKIVFDTRPPVDVDQLRQGSDLMGELLRSMQEVADDPPRLAELKHELKALGDKAALELHEADVLWEDPQQLRRWLQQAEALLISRLTEDEP